MYQKILKRVSTGMCAHMMHGMTIILRSHMKAYQAINLSGSSSSLCSMRI